MDTLTLTTWCLVMLHKKSDVYSFGVLLHVLLTGEKARDANRPRNFRSMVYMAWNHVQIDLFNKIVDPKILREGGGDEQLRELKDFLELALACTKDERQAIPNMIDVAKELMRIVKPISPC